MILQSSEDWLSARAQVTPQATAILIGDKRWTYSQLDALVNQVVLNISEYVQVNARIAVFLPNNLAFVCLVHAAARCGAILVPLNTRLSDEELNWQLNFSKCSVLVVEEKAVQRFKNLDTASLTILNTFTLLAELPKQSKRRSPSTNQEDIQAIVFTSGTTGKPKGAKLTFANHFFSAVASSYRLGVLSNDIWLCCLPLYHVGGLAILLRSCLYGTAIDLHHGFDVATISESLDNRDITLISLVPTMVQRLLQYRAGQPWPTSLRHVLIGGAAVTPELIQQCHDQGIPVSVTYGLTEAASQVATMTPDDVARKPGSAGKPLLFTQLAILSDEGYELSANEAGEIVVRGPTIMAGYDQDLAATERVLQGGWLHTGDVGMLDKEGDLWVLQRRVDIIVSGGENIYPVEVEEVLQAHPAVNQVCVVGIADQEWGQRAAAAIILNDEILASENELITFCRQHLAGYKIPRQVVFLPKMPLTASGKIHRRAVADLIEANKYSS